jgi:hypothetical protein
MPHTRSMLDGKLNLCFAGGFRSVMQPNRRLRCWAPKGVSRMPPPVLHVISLQARSGVAIAGPEHRKAPLLEKSPAPTPRRLRKALSNLGFLSFLPCFIHPRWHRRTVTDRRCRPLVWPCQSPKAPHRCPRSIAILVRYVELGRAVLG